MAATLRPYGELFPRLKTLIRGAGAAVLLASLFLPRLCSAVAPKYFEVEGQRIETRDGTVTVKLSIGVDNPTGLFEMLKDGASVELLANAKLERVRTLWTNQVLAETELVSLLRHNPLTREFSLYMPNEDKPLLDKNLDRLLEATWKKFAIPFGPLSLLDANEKDTAYRVTLTLRLQHAKPPPWLAKGFMVWSKDILDPEKIIMDFLY